MQSLVETSFSEFTSTDISIRHQLPQNNSLMLGGALQFRKQLVLFYLSFVKVVGPSNHAFLVSFLENMYLRMRNPRQILFICLCSEGGCAWFCEDAMRWCQFPEGLLHKYCLTNTVYSLHLWYLCSVVMMNT